MHQSFHERMAGFNEDTPAGWPVSLRTDSGPMPGLVFLSPASAQPVAHLWHGNPYASIDDPPPTEIDDFESFKPSRIRIELLPGEESVRVKNEGEDPIVAIRHREKSTPPNRSKVLHGEVTVIHIGDAIDTKPYLKKKTAEELRSSYFVLRPAANAPPTEVAAKDKDGGWLRFIPGVPPSHARHTLCSEGDYVTSRYEGRELEASTMLPSWLCCMASRPKSQQTRQPISPGPH